LGGGGFLVVLRLPMKVNSGFVFYHLQEHGRFIQTVAAHGAGRVDIIRAGGVKRMLAVLVGHVAVLPTSNVAGNVFVRLRTPDYL
jgi:hypothetical protein